MKHRKIEYIRQMKKSDNKTKTMWNIINTKLGKTKHRNKLNLTLKIKNEEIKCPLAISNIFNQFFATVGENCNKNSNIAVGRPVIKSPTHSMYLNPVNQKEVENIIRLTKNKHSCGIDDIPPILMKQCAEELSFPLTYIINQSFLDGQFPDLLKISLVKPIHKKGDLHTPSHYRPIALLPTFSKVFEKAMCNRLYKFLEKYNILDDSQHGFRKSRSTTLAVYKYVQTALQHINDKKYVIGLLLDMTKAYDKVQYNILLDKLYGSGVRGPAYLWFKSYLENRTQIVQIEHYDTDKNEIQLVRSRETTMSCSIPQGSVLGCILFLIYINDLPKVLDNKVAVPVLFADDMSILLKYDNTENNPIIQHTLHTITQWLQDHNLEINYTKTKVMQFRSYKKKPITINTNFKNIPLETVDTFKLLGLTIDTNINWKEHIEYIKIKLSRFTYALFQLKCSTNTDTALAAYYAYAYSWLRYGVMLWGNSVNSHDLFVLQKKCIRIIAQIDNQESCKPFFMKYNLLTLPSIYIYDICTFVFKNLNNFIKVNETHTRNTRNKDKLHLPQARINMLNYSPCYMAIKIFNKLPNEIKNQTAIKPFEKELKEYLIKNCFYSIAEYFEI